MLSFLSKPFSPLSHPLNKMKTTKRIFLTRTRWIFAASAIVAVASLICYTTFAHARPRSGAPAHASEPDSSKSAAEWLEQFYRPLTVSPSEYAKAAATARALPVSPVLQGREFKPAAPLTSSWVFQALSPMWNEWGSPQGGWGSRKGSELSIDTG